MKNVKMTMIVILEYATMKKNVLLKLKAKNALIANNVIKMYFF